MGNTIKVALVGTGMSLPLLDEIKKGVPKAQFPGFEKVFKAELDIDKSRIIKITPEEFHTCRTVDELTRIYMQAAQRLKDTKVAYDVLIVELPREAERFFRGQDVDLHDFMKISFLEKDIPTQIVTSRTLSSQDDYKYADLALGIYVSAGGRPWKLEKQPTDTCFIGICFGLRPSGSQTDILVGIAEIFDNHGESISIRSASQVYDERKGYHLSAESLDFLIKNLLEDYQKSLNVANAQLPSKVVIHKTSHFNDEELGTVGRLEDLGPDFELVYVNTPSLRLMPDLPKMPYRGTYWRIDNEKALLYTDGYVPHAKGYLGVGSPRPFLITKQAGTSSIDTIINQIFLLTKLNWNSTKNHERSPVTISHARKIVDMLRAGLKPESIVKDFRYYL